MNIVLNEPLSQVSLLFVSAAMGFLAVALLLFSFKLAKLKDDASETRFEKFGFWVLGIATVVLACEDVTVCTNGSVTGATT